MLRVTITHRVYNFDTVGPPGISKISKLEQTVYDCVERLEFRAGDVVRMFFAVEGVDPKELFGFTKIEITP